MDDIHALVVDEVQEIMEIERRKQYIIVHNLPENENPNDDKKRITDIVRQQLDLHQELEISESIRLGKKQDRNGKPRLIRICVENFMVRSQLLREANKFRKLYRTQYPVASNIYISQDYTLKQRERNRILCDQLKQKRQDTGNNDWIIKNGKIVLRQGH